MSAPNRFGMLLPNLLPPKKPTGRPQVLTDAQIDEFENFIRLSREKRQVDHLELADGPLKYWGLSEQTIKRHLRQRGYGRRGAVQKPPSYRGKNKITKKVG